MFARDYNNLNDLYNNKIIKENVGLGPLADSETVMPKVSSIKKIEMPPKKSCGCEQEEHCAAAAEGCKCNGCPECKANQNAKNEECEGYDSNTHDSNGEMARQLLFRCAKLSAMLHDILAGKDNIEAWVLSKLTNAHDQLESVFGYEDYESAKNPEHGMCGADNFEESNEEEILQALSTGGDKLLQNIRNVLKRESKEMLEKVLLEAILILEDKKKV